MDLKLSSHTSSNEVYYYQDVNCSFYVNGLGKAISSNEVDSIYFKLSNSFFSYSTMFKSQDFENDTLSFEMRGDLMLADSITELFSSDPKDYFFYGQLYLYHGNKVHKKLDALVISYVNPIKNNRMTGNLLDEKREGRWLEYYDFEKKDLGRISHFLNGKRQGKDSVFKNGKLHILSNWHKGKKDGEFLMFWPNGKTRWKTTHDNGIQNSKTYIFDSNEVLFDSLAIGE